MSAPASTLVTPRASSRSVHRTAVLALHCPTQHARAALDQAFAAYTRAYTAALYAFRMLAPAQILEMATYGIDRDGHPLRAVRKLQSALFSSPSRALLAALDPLEGGLRESLRAEVARTLLSWAVLVTREVTFVTIDDNDGAGRDTEDAAAVSSPAALWSGTHPKRLRPEDIEPRRRAAHAALAVLADDLDQEQTLISQLQCTAQPSLVPLPFCRIDAERTCGLFYNLDTRSYYVRLFVVSPRSRFAHPLTVAGHYQDLKTGHVYARSAEARDHPELHSFGAGTTSLLLPLELGRVHEQPLRFTEVALLPWHDRDEMEQRLHSATQPVAAEPVAARLIKRDDRYLLHVAFRIPVPPRKPTRTIFGIDRGIACLAAGAVLARDGHAVLARVRLDGSALNDQLRRVEQETASRQQRGQTVRARRRRRAMGDVVVHVCANQIIELACAHAAQIVMEDLSSLARPWKRRAAPVEPRKRANFRAMLSRRQYQKLLHVVNAALPLVGLPPVRLVAPHATSITCNACGHIDAANRDSRDRQRFACVRCGHRDHADVQAGVNIARKALWLDQRIREAKTSVPTAQRTSWPTFAATMAVKTASTS